MKRSARRFIKKNKHFAGQHAHTHLGLETQGRGGWEEGPEGPEIRGSAGAGVLPL